MSRRPLIGYLDWTQGSGLARLGSRRPGCRSHIGCPRWSCGSHLACDVPGAAMGVVRQWPDRCWAIEGCNGFGRHVANRLLAEGEPVVDVPPKLSARARLFATGRGRMTPA